MREHAGIAIDIGDLALDRRGCAVTGIEGESAEFLGERRDVDDGRADGAGSDGEHGFLAGGGIDEFEFFIGHDGEALQGASSGTSDIDTSLTRPANGIKATTARMCARAEYVTRLS